MKYLLKPYHSHTLKQSVIEIILMRHREAGMENWNQDKGKGTSQVFLRGTAISADYI